MKKNKSLSDLRFKAPTILTCVGAIGVILTSIASSKATLKADKLLKQAKDDKKELTKIETLGIVIPIYIPSVLIGVSTLACIFGANVLNKRNQAALMSAYALIDNSFKEYRNKLIELHGEEADIEIRDAIARENCNYHQIGLDTPDTKMRFYEPLSDTFFYAYEREVMDAEYHLNRNFIMRGYSPFSEFLDFLGINNANGDDIGWSCDYGYCWLDFEHRKAIDDYGEPYYRIVSIFAPDEDYLSQWE